VKALAIIEDSSEHQPLLPPTPISLAVVKGHADKLAVLGGGGSFQLPADLRQKIGTENVTRLYVVKFRSSR